MRKVGHLVSIVDKGEPGIVAKILSNNKILVWLVYSAHVELFDSSDEKLVEFDSAWLEAEAIKSYLRITSYSILESLEAKNLEIIANIYAETAMPH